MATKVKCIISGCSKPSKIRGVCHNHYHSVYRAIRSGELSSWAAAARKGLASGEKAKPGPKR